MREFTYSTPGTAPPEETDSGHHFSCSMTAVLLGLIHAHGGDAAVSELLERASISRSVDYLQDTGNWISYSEAAALWKAGGQVTRHPQFARLVGEEAARRLGGSPVAALLRSLGSPEHVYREMAQGASKFSTVSRLEVTEVRPGYAEIAARAADGFSRSPDLCAWTTGLLSQPTLLFGLPPAIVEHDTCAAFGADSCLYRIRWKTADEAQAQPATAQVGALRAQLEAMRERLHGMFATAADLIAAEEIDSVLARITDRAAVEVRAPHYLLTVRLPGTDQVLCHHKGLTEDEAAACSARLETEHPASLPPSWMSAPVRSQRHDYGWLLAMEEPGRTFFPQERDLLEVYARYAASALDSATALAQAQQLYGQSRALLELARALSTAGTSDEVALRLADAVPIVVDCDRVEIFLWDEASGELVHRASAGGGLPAAAVTESSAAWRRAPTPGTALEQMLRDPQSGPMFVDAGQGHPALREHFAALGAVATILVPLAAGDSFLGLLAVSVADRPERLNPVGNLLDRLSGVAAQATTALQNGLLVDAITHQALHDSLTGLANRLHFSDDLREAIHEAAPTSRRVTVFYIDLDGFKPINDLLGHAVGDELLVAVGDRLRSCTRATDTVARLGGDEFAVLIGADAVHEHPEMVSDRLNKAFEAPFEIGEQRLHVGASIGCATFPADATTAEELLSAADTAMFGIKRTTKEDSPATP